MPCHFTFMRACQAAIQMATEHANVKPRRRHVALDIVWYIWLYICIYSCYSPHSAVWALRCKTNMLFWCYLASVAGNKQRQLHCVAYAQHAHCVYAVVYTSILFIYLHRLILHQLCRSPRSVLVFVYVLFVVCRNLVPHRSCSESDSTENYKRNSLQDVIAPTPASVDKEVVQQQQHQQQQDNDGGDSLTSSLAIEGFVQGASEDFTVQSQTAAYEVDEV